MSARISRRRVEDAIAKVGALIAPVLIALIRDVLREELRGTGEADPWVPHPQWPCASRRAACALARSGALEGVRRVGLGRGALYLVRRSALDAWIEAHPVDVMRAEQDDDFEREMAHRGLVPNASAAQRSRCKSCRPAREAARAVRAYAHDQALRRGHAQGSS